MFRHAGAGSYAVAAPGAVHAEAAARRHRRAREALPRARLLRRARHAPTSRCSRASTATRRTSASASTINERKRIAVAFEGNAQQVVVDAARRADAADARLVRRLRGRRQRRRHPALLPGSEGYFFARVDWRRERLSADEERIVFMIDEGPAAEACAASSSSATAAAGGRAGRGRVGAQVPAAGYIGLGSGGYVTGRQMEQDVERLVEHYRGAGFLEAKARAEAATSRGGAWGRSAPWRRPPRRVARRRGPSTSATPSKRGRSVRGRRPRTSSTDERRPAALHKHASCSRASSLRPGDPYTPGADARRRPAPGAAARRRRLRRRPPPTPRSSRDGERVRADLGDQARAARPRRPDLRARQLRHQRPRPSWSRSRCGPGGYLTTTAFERGQRNLGFLQLFNNAAPISFPGKDEGRDGGAHGGGGRGALRAVQRAAPGRGHLDRTGAARLVAARSAATSRGGYENRNLLGPRLEPRPVSLTYGTVAAARPPRASWTAASSGRCSASTSRCNYLQQETVRLGDIRSGGGLDRVLARDVPRRRRRHSLQPAQHDPHRAAAPRRRAPTRPSASVRLGTTVGSLSANVEWLRHGQPPGADARVSHQRARRAGAADAVGAAAAVSARRRRRHVPQGQRPVAVGDAARSLAVRCATASASSRASRWAARRCCPRSSATSRAATPPSAATSSIARASSVVRYLDPLPAATSSGSSTGPSAATCASCRTSTCSFRSARPGTAPSSWTTASSPTRWTACAPRSSATASACRRC